MRCAAACTWIGMLVGLLGTGCSTAVGRYFEARARDLGDCVRLECGVAPAIGLDASAAGLLHFGLGWCDHVDSCAVGWAYGAALWPVEGSAETTTAFMHFPFAALAPQWGQDWPFALWPGAGFHRCWGNVSRRGSKAFHHQHRCWWFLPALADILDPLDEDAGAWGRVHAFDVEFGLYVVGYMRVGFSPGEFVDFLLGWIGLDIAGDDLPTREDSRQTGRE